MQTFYGENAFLQPVEHPLEQWCDEFHHKSAKFPSWNNNTKPWVDIEC